MPLGKALVSAGLVSAQQLLAAVRLQTTSLFMNCSVGVMVRRLFWLSLSMMS